MDKEIIFGIAIIAGSLGLMSWLVFWSRRRIMRLATARGRKGRGKSIREALRELEE